MELEFLLYILVGMGTGWTAGDALWSETPIFVTVFPAGLEISSQLSACGQLAGFWLLMGFLFWKYCCRELGDSSGGEARGGGRGVAGNNLPEAVQMSVVWWSVLAQWICVVVLALGWRVTVRGGVPLVLFLIMCVAQTIGTLNTLVVMPFVSTWCAPRLVSALSLGVQVSSMLAGLLGMIQRPSENVQPSFGPSVFYAFFAVVLLASVAGWARVYTARIGFKSSRQDQHEGTKNFLFRGAEREARSDDEDEDEDEDEAAVEEELTALEYGGGGDQVDGVVVDQDRSPIWLWWTVLPLDVMAWGFAPSLLPFAATATAGVCDQSNAHIVTVLRYAISMSFFALPLAALTTSVVPTSNRRYLAAIAAVGIVAFLIEATAVLKIAPGFWRGALAAPLLVACHFTLRFTDTYVVTMGFRIIAEQYITTARRQHHSETLGLLVTAGCLLSTLTAYALVHLHVIGC